MPKLIPFLPPLERKHLRRSRERYQLERDGYLFGRSREVVSTLVGSLRLSHGDVILVPASLCWEALSPILAQGVIARCYPLDARLFIDVEALKGLICHRTKAIYVVHYFGYPQPNMPTLRYWCDKNGLKLIEDCALCFFYSGSPVGLWGDVSFYSLWKFLPIPNGAIGICRNGVQLLPPRCRPASTWGIKRMLRLLVNYLVASGSVPMFDKLLPSVSKVAPDEPPGPAELPKVTVMSAVSRFILSRCDIESVAAARRTNYYSLVEGVDDIEGLEPIWREFPAYAVPYALPIRVSDPVYLQRALIAKGIETEISINRFFRNHPQIEGCPGDFKVLDDLADGVLSLPVHQGISNSDIERIIRSLHEVT